MADCELLIIEGNTAKRSAELRAQGGGAYADIYRKVLGSIAPAATCRVLHPCEDDVGAAERDVDLAAVDGAVWTGSSLHAYGPLPEVKRQIALFEKLFDAGVPIFGSCWGLQVMATALGGQVRRNPWGREIGVAREISLTAAGAAHPMFAGKPARFDSIAMHVDEVELLPSGSVVLARNDASPVQAAVLERGGRSFWGVQYHPEFDLGVLALGIRRAEADLIAETFFASSTALGAVCESLVQIENCPETSGPARSILGISNSVLDPSMRRLEISNWIAHIVRPRAKARREAIVVAGAAS